MIKNWRILLVILFLLGGAWLSGTLLLQHHDIAWGKAAVAEMCGDDANSGCNAVNQSAWSEVGGVPLAALGLFFYLSMITLLAAAVFSKQELRLAIAQFVLAGLALSLLIDLGLLGIQATIIGDYCKLCLSTYALGGLSLALLLPALRQPWSSVRALVAPENRSILGAWVAACIILAGGLAAGEVAMKEISKLQSFTMLLGTTPLSGSSSDQSVPASPQGTPSMPSFDLGTSTDGSSDTELPSKEDAQGVEMLRMKATLMAAQQEQKRLQDILDDDEKLSEYVKNRKLRAFQTGKQFSFQTSEKAMVGTSQSPVSIVEFFDYQCAHCRQLHQSLEHYKPLLNPRVKLYYKNYPLDAECNERLMGRPSSGSCSLALGGICAAEQDQFETYHSKAFEKPNGRPTPESVIDMAARLGLDEARFRGCMNSPSTAAQLKASIFEAQKAGVEGTPTLFINGRKVPQLDMLFSLISEELVQAGERPLQ